MDNGPRRCNNGWWEVYNPADDIYYMYGSKAAANAAMKRMMSDKIVKS